MNEVTLLIESPLWEKQEKFDKWKIHLDSFLGTTAKTLCLSDYGFSLNLLLTDNQKIKELNRNFRNKDSETNILSFPQYDADFFKTLENNKEIFLGDIAMSCEKILEECKSYDITFFERSSHLFVHGILHLFGFDHTTDAQANDMENLEIKILSEFEIGNPYI